MQCKSFLFPRLVRLQATMLLLHCVAIPAAWPEANKLPLVSRRPHQAINPMCMNNSRKRQPSSFQVTCPISYVGGYRVYPIRQMRPFAISHLETKQMDHIQIKSGSRGATAPTQISPLVSICLVIADFIHEIRRTMSKPLLAA
ncbi:hypothetical protein F5B22DRAFT_250373 [Xylaria bambusicola]|uniref:uncharacterized protein n=1 Tax=Xylaria bambusicola TaxID=326684 RepID=UPI00200752EC|nr:uncharacterized protein F5B22DRAFT_250373 [Xylaria bambusicola]KAI0525735.1 hypothetical protein F5B22DRAFT_250373 [Xylaria bambusicola]